MTEIKPLIFCYPNFNILIRNLAVCKPAINLFNDIHIQVNGNISLPENVADNGGLHASFRVSCQ